MIFAGWEMRQWQHWLMGQLFASYGFKAIILTWGRTMVTTDPELTVQHFTSVKNKCLEIINQLPKRQQQHVSFFAMSHGSGVAMMVANAVPRLESIVLNLSGADLAEIVWTWSKTVPELKKSLQKRKISLKSLKELWAPISPLNNISQVKVKRVLIYLAARDERIPFTQQERLVAAFKEHGIPVTGIINTRHHHLLSEIINLLKFDIYMSFLKGEPTNTLLRRH